MGVGEIDRGGSGGESICGGMMLSARGGGRVRQGAVMAWRQVVQQGLYGERSALWCWQLAILYGSKRFRGTHARRKLVARSLSLLCVSYDEAGGRGARTREKRGRGRSRTKTAPFCHSGAGTDSKKYHRFVFGRGGHVGAGRALSCHLSRGKEGNRAVMGLSHSLCGWSRLRVDKRLCGGVGGELRQALPFLAFHAACFLPGM